MAANSDKHRFNFRISAHVKTLFHEERVANETNMSEQDKPSFQTYHTQFHYRGQTCHVHVFNAYQNFYVQLDHHLL